MMYAVQTLLGLWIITTTIIIIIIIIIIFIMILELVGLSDCAWTYTSATTVYVLNSLES